MMTKHKILLIEDEPAYSQMLLDYVELSEPGIELIIAASADKTVELLETSPPIQFTAVILDIAMPPGEVFKYDDTRGGTWTGVLLYERLGRWIDKFDHLWPKFPVAVHTHITDQALQDRLIELHRTLWPKLPVRFLYKPMAPSDFFKQMGEWLNSL